MRRTIYLVILIFIWIYLTYSANPGLYLDKAKNGNPKYQYKLANEYFKERNYKKAIYWYKKAANKNLSAAQHNLGGIYVYGYGVLKDYKKAIKWYKKAAENGNPKSQYYLGIIYEKKTGLDKDKKKAVYWYEKAAKNGLPMAQGNLAKMYLHGIGVKVDKSKAKYWIDKAYNNKNTHESVKKRFKKIWEKYELWKY